MLKRQWRRGKEGNCRPARDSRGGQSLVELAIAFPILLLLFVGLMEVGLLLRSYLVLVNANREAARYAGRAQEFEDAEGEDVTNAVIAYRAIDSAASLRPNLAVDGGNFTVFIHRFLIDTGQPGDTSDDDIRIGLPAVPSRGDCPAPCVHDCATWFTTYNYEHTFYYTGTITTTLGQVRASGVDPQAKCNQLFNDNEDFNEEMATHEAAIEQQTPPVGVDDGIYETSFLELVIVELFYDHSQALQLPIFTAFVPDPIELRTATEMRITGTGRQKTAQ